MDGCSCSVVTNYNLLYPIEKQHIMVMKNNMLKRLLLLAVLMTPLAMAAQITLPQTHISFNFPNGGWKYLQTTNVDKVTKVYLYSYNDHYVVDSVGDTIIPYMRVYVRQSYGGSVYDMAYNRFLTQPFQSLDEYLLDQPAPGTLGYWGAYTSDADGKDYEFLMYYFKEKNTIVEVRLETTRDNYEEFEAEFKAILGSFTIGK